LTKGVNAACARVRRAATDPVGSGLGEWPGDTGDGWRQQQIDLGEECSESIGDCGACQQRTSYFGARPRQPLLDLPGDIRIEDGRILAEGVSIECGEEREFRFSNWLAGDVCAMCALENPGKSEVAI